MLRSNFNLHIRVAQGAVTCMTLVAILLNLFFLAGCRNDDSPQLETDRIRELLTSGTWTVESVSIDGVDKTDMYAGLAVTFTNSGFTVTNGGMVWPGSGAWTFADDTGKRLLRSDDIMMDVREINESRLVLAFTWNSTTFGPGRVSSLSGEHVFTFHK